MKPATKVAIVGSSPARHNNFQFLSIFCKKIMCISTEGQKGRQWREIERERDLRERERDSERKT